MSTQPEALRLADELERYHGEYPTCTESATELRRLHAENERLHQINWSHEMKLSVRGYEIQIADLEAQRDALLEALKLARPYISTHTMDGYRAEVKADAALRAALAQQDEPETCTWHQDGDSDSGTYSTSCRRFFNLEDGTPEHNKMHWCCYCGKKLAQELITEDDDE